MTTIFPPQGPQDPHRARSVKETEREYIWFCLEFCNSILVSRPEHLEALELAANHYTELGYFQDGLRLDSRLARLRPDNPGVQYNLACSQALTGHIDAALDSLARAIRFGYRDHRHMAVDEDLAPLRGDPRFAALLAAVEPDGERQPGLAP